MRYQELLSSVSSRWRYHSVSSNTTEEGDESSEGLFDSEKAQQQQSLFLDIGKPKHQHWWQLHPSVCTLILGLLLSANLIVVSVILTTTMRLAKPEYPIVQPRSDAIFGHIPVRETMWQPDELFTSVDPWDGAYWNNGTSSKGSTAWDTLFRSAWVAVEDPAAHGLTGGVPLRHFAPPDFKEAWPESAEGYVPTVIHQLHCVGIMKHLIEVQRNAGTTGESNTGGYASVDQLFKHGEHCVEYFRHSFMCAADLTLEPPESIDLVLNKVHGTEGWGASHYCRDWDMVHDKVWNRLIRFLHIEGHGMMVVPDRA